MKYLLKAGSIVEGQLAWEESILDPFRWHSGKEFVCQCRRCNRGRFDPWVGKIPLEETMATHSGILAWKIPWMVEPGGLPSRGPPAT